MKKAIGSTVLLAMALSANGDIYLNSGVKDYSNSKTKVDGKTNTVGFDYKYKQNSVNINYAKDEVDRIHPMTKKSIEQLNVKKYNLNYKYQIDDALSVKASYIKIIDNIAPTDQGRIYGIGAKYNFIKGFGSSFDVYKSDYESFNVNQYDVSIFKGFKIGKVKSKLTLLAKKIQIDGEKYGNYSFEDKDYFTTGIKINSTYNGYVGGVGAFFGKRVFTVLKDGAKVQHHAMEQDKTYMLSLGKKFKNFDVIATYSFQNGTELPENQDDVDTKVTSLMLKYKF
jgi:hypothetical protein